MKMQNEMDPEDVQNRVRNALSSIQTVIDICEILQHNELDTNIFKDALKFFKDTDIIKYAKNSVQHLIDIGAAVDQKINDKTYCVEDHIKELNR